MTQPRTSPYGAREKDGSPPRALGRSVERALRKARLIASVPDALGRDWRHLYWWESLLPNGTVFPYVTNRNRGPGVRHYSRDLVHVIADSLQRNWDLPVTGPGRQLVVQHDPACLASTAECTCRPRVTHAERIDAINAAHRETEGGAA